MRGRPVFPPPAPHRQPTEVGEPYAPERPAPPPGPGQAQQPEHRGAHHHAFPPPTARRSQERPERGGDDAAPRPLPSQAPGEHQRPQRQPVGQAVADRTRHEPSQGRRPDRQSHAVGPPPTSGLPGTIDRTAPRAAQQHARRRAPRHRRAQGHGRLAWPAARRRGLRHHSASVAPRRFNDAEAITRHDDHAALDTPRPGPRTPCNVDPAALGAVSPSPPQPGPRSRSATGVLSEVSAALHRGGASLLSTVSADLVRNLDPPSADRGAPRAVDVMMRPLAPARRRAHRGARPKRPVRPRPLTLRRHARRHALRQARACHAPISPAAWVSPRSTSSSSPGPRDRGDRRSHLTPRPRRPPRWGWGGYLDDRLDRRSATAGCPDLQVPTAGTCVCCCAGGRPA